MKLQTMALNNIKRNFKKYFMYFFSLCFSVFTAYSFIALTDNESVQQKFSIDTRYQSMLIAFGIIIMVFVLFFLISSNKSFIRARKKEISTYALFGMSHKRIGQLLFAETMMVGTAALIIGIGLGVFFSKLVAMVLLDITMLSYKGTVTFSISPVAIAVTIVMFFAIFCVMGISGRWVISRFELVDLFKADKVAEKRSKGSYLLMLLSILMIGGGYYLAASANPMTVVSMTIPILALTIIGTYIFFWGGLPKVLTLIKKHKNSYFKAGNLVSTASFSHRMRSIGSVMATIAVLSAVATTAIATGFTMYRNIEKNIYDQIGYDFYFYGRQDSVINDVHAALEKHAAKILNEMTVQRYYATPKTESIDLGYYVLFGEEEPRFRVYSQSIYNDMVSFSRSPQEPLDIKDDEAYFAMLSTRNMKEKLMGHMFQFTDKTLTVVGFTDAEYLEYGALHMIVVSNKTFDELVANGDVTDRDTAGNLYDKATVLNYTKALSSRDLNNDLVHSVDGKVGSYRSAFTNYSEMLEIFGLVCFIGYFMSAVFILMTASLLYFKQIMAAEEEQHHYSMLRKIGIDDQLEKKIITKRLLPVFFVPLLVGISHSIFAMKSADTLVFKQMIPVDNSYLTVLAFSGVMYGVYALVYSIFYLITKRQYSRIVK